MSEEFWIKDAIKEERVGTYRTSVLRRYGKSGFVGNDPKEGRIRRSIISRDSKRKDRIGKQARLAKTLRGLKT